MLGDGIGPGAWAGLTATGSGAFKVALPVSTVARAALDWGERAALVGVGPGAREGVPGVVAATPYSADGVGGTGAIATEAVVAPGPEAAGVRLGGMRAWPEEAR